MKQIVFSYVAVKPIRAEHPVGSGTIVQYAPGDIIPAGEWGRAADNLTELGKAVRLAVNIDVEDEGDGQEEDMGGGGGQSAPSDPEQSGLVASAGGWYTLSDGSRVRGKKAAEEAQALLEG